MNGNMTSIFKFAKCPLGCNCEVGVFFTDMSSHRIHDRPSSPATFSVPHQMPGGFEKFPNPNGTTLEAIGRIFKNNGT